MATLKQEYGTNEEVNLGKEDTIVTYAAGGQTNATLITRKWSEIIQNDADYGSVKIAPAKIAARYVVYNNTDFIASVFPTESESINNIDDYQFNIAPRSVVVFESQKDGKLFSNTNSI